MDQHVSTFEACWERIQDSNCEDVDDYSSMK
jgi:hypothetical protein